MDAEPYWMLLALARNERNSSKRSSPSPVSGVGEAGVDRFVGIGVMFLKHDH